MSTTGVLWRAGHCDQGSRRGHLMRRRRQKVRMTTQICILPSGIESAIILGQQQQHQLMASIATVRFNYCVYCDRCRCIFALGRAFTEKPITQPLRLNCDIWVCTLWYAGTKPSSWTYSSDAELSEMVMVTLLCVPPLDFISGAAVVVIEFYRSVIESRDSVHGSAHLSVWFTLRSWFCLRGEQRISEHIPGWCWHEIFVPRFGS